MSGWKASIIGDGAISARATRPGKRPVPAEAHEEDSGLGVERCIVAVGLLLRLGRLRVGVLVLAELVVRVVVRHAAHTPRRTAH